MVALDTTIVNVALDRLTKELHSPLTQIQWVVAAYLLAIAAVIPISGWLSRRIGPRRVLLGALALFTFGSALCGLAGSAAELIGFRVVQGLGGGLILPVGQLLIAAAAGPRNLGRVMGLAAAPVVLSPLFGPLIGGLILDRLDWSWIFFVNVPIGVLAIALGSRLLPRARLGSAGPLDVRGLALLVVAMPSIIYGVSEFGSAASLGSPSFQVVIPVAVGLLLVALFVVHALSTPHPLLDVRLYRNRAYAWAQTAATLNGACVFGALILWPLYFQEVRRYDVLDTGVLAAVHGVGVCAMLPWAGRLADRFGGGNVATVGILISVVASVPLVMVTAHTSLVLVEATLFVRGLGVGLAVLPVTVSAFAALLPDQIGDGAAQLNVLQRVGGSLGTALFAVVLARATATLGVAPSHEDLAHAFDTTFAWVLALSAVGLVPCLMLRAAERRRARALQPAEIAEATTLLG
jgi:EmrB/QacA subfamily drug resistance transporter